jgi:hypothetical protein
VLAERAVIGGVPVAGRYHEGGLARHLVDRFDDCVPLGHGERTTGTEVILHIDDD